jgi:hypothetical protein
MNEETHTLQALLAGLQERFPDADFTHPVLTLTKDFRLPDGSTLEAEFIEYHRHHGAGPITWNYYPPGIDTCPEGPGAEPPQPTHTHTTILTATDSIEQLIKFITDRTTNH